jgi:carbon-monoxide dehydrogenase small subunit
MRGGDAMKSIRLTSTVNGRRRTFDVGPLDTLLDALRGALGLTGVKRGCEIGECGACTVLLDGLAVNACLVPAAQAHGRVIETVEGLAPAGRLTPLQEAFLDHDAVHCGFCTPGMLMSASALLASGDPPCEGAIRDAIAGNLCRCTGYQPIVDAIHAAAALRAGERPDAGPDGEDR